MSRADVNPYRIALGRARRARGWDPVPVLALAGGALAAGLLQREVFDFVPSLGTAAALDAVAGLVGRVGLLLGAGLTLGTYDVVIRGPDRAVLDLHPLLPGPWYRARVTESARDRLPWLLAALGALWPIGDLTVIALATFALTGAWFCGLGVGIGINLAAPVVGLNPTLAPMLDAIRGMNPRLQAALLYAPGTALGIAGFGILGGAAGVAQSLYAPSPWLLAPWLLGGLGLVLGARFAASAARLPALLGEIDAAYAAAESPDEARIVYLEWAVRFAPTGLRIHLLRELRHVWRAHRGWATGAWGLSLIAAFAAWSGQLWLGLALVAVVAAAGLVLVDPPWVAHSLAVSERRIRFARGLALVGIAAPVWLAGAGSALLGGHGVGPGLVLLGGSVCFSALATVSGRLYVPLSVGLVGLVAALGGGW